jgi:hypothetical protein
VVARLFNHLVGQRPYISLRQVRTSYNESILLKPQPSYMARTTRMGVLFQLSLSRFG